MMALAAPELDKEIRAASEYDREMRTSALIKFAFAILVIIMPVTTICIDKVVTLPYVLIFFTELFYLQQTCCENRQSPSRSQTEAKYEKSIKMKVVWEHGKYFLIKKDANIRRRPGKAEVARPMRSAAPKDKASSQKHADPIQYQTCGGGGQVHNQQADTDDEPLKSNPSNQSSHAPSILYIEDGGAVSSEINSSPPNQTANYAEESSDIESRTSSPPAVNQTPPHDDNNEGNESTPPNEYREHKYELETAFILGSQILSAAVAIWTKNGTSEMSSEARCLSYVLLGCIFLSLISSFYHAFLSDRKRPRIAARIARGIACVSTALALLTATGLQLPNHIMLWGTLGAYAVSMPAIIGYAMKK